MRTLIVLMMAFTACVGSPVPGLPSCLNDDGEVPAGYVACYWDAQSEGNGLGESFVSYSS